jgi:hypothetical protein
MQPHTAAPQAFLAAERAWRDAADAGDVITTLCHRTRVRTHKTSR